MNDLEQLLTTRMEDRAERVAITLDLDSVTSSPVGENSASRERRPRLLAAAAATVVIGGGVVALAQFGPEDSPGTAQESSTVDPYAGLPREGPVLLDHWHVPYGINICGEWFELTGDLEERDDDLMPVHSGFAASGIHSHDDGLMHIHPFGEAGTGANATLGTFLTNYGVELTDLSLTFPPEQADGRQLIEGGQGCGDGPASLAVIVWPDPDDSSSRVIVTEALAGTPLGADGIVMAVAFTDDPASIEMPPSIVDAEQNAQIEG